MKKISAVLLVLLLLGMILFSGCPQEPPLNEGNKRFEEEGNGIGGTGEENGISGDGENGDQPPVVDETEASETEGIASDLDELLEGLEGVEEDLR